MNDLDFECKTRNGLMSIYNSLYIFICIAIVNINFKFSKRQVDDKFAIITLR